MRIVSQVFKDLYRVHHEGGSRCEYKIVCGENQSHFLPDPDILPTSEVVDCCFNSVYTRLVTIQNKPPYIAIYDTTVIPYNKLPNPKELPTGEPNSCQYSQDGKHLVITHKEVPYFTLYDVAQDVNTKIPMQSAECECVMGEFQNNRLYLSQIIAYDPIIAYDLTTYQRIGGTVREVPTPIKPPTSEVMDCCFNTKYTRLTVLTKEAPYIIIYDTTKVPYERISNPIEPPPSIPNSCQYSKDGKFLVITYSEAPYFTLYNVEFDSNSKVAIQGADFPCVMGEFQDDKLYLAQMPIPNGEKVIIAYELTNYQKVDEPIPKIFWRNDVAYNVNILKAILCVGIPNKPYIALYSGVSSNYEPIPKILWKNSVAYNLNNAREVLCVGSKQTPYIILYDDMEVTVNMEDLYGALNVVDGISDNSTFDIGTVYMGSLRFTTLMLNNRIPVLDTKSKLYIRMVSDRKQSEWVLYDEYIIDKIEYDYAKKRAQLSCFDSIQLLKKPFIIPTETKTYKQILDIIESSSGLQVRNFPSDAESLTVASGTLSGNMKLRDILSYILITIGCNAKANGEFIDIVPLQFYPFSNPNAMAIDGNHTRPEIKFDKIGAVKLTDKDNVEYVAGNTEYKIFSKSIPFATQTHADYMLSKVEGYINIPVRILDSFVTPELQAGDMVQSEYTGETFFIGNVSGSIHAAYKVDLEQGTLGTDL